ncbi:nucleolar and coiled-body phosphoprotein 1-like [Topomyia yanbarensis]|uniref:nucleolar and coiled-body phosphoprotein 1-like n=1 Tax=Topomyia yanbarensis TaxID=2498891 RepID=UPI00273C8961|nr:nucleolar and coiled-body phosphoprotein 1-like [Topomyia yanbarensis]
MGKDIDPADIGKHPDLIRKAQAEMTQSDVLVCGRCHSVFHFIELFKEHKEQECRKESTLKDCRETKAKVWAFLLWKAAQLNVEVAGNVNSWKLYQTWVKLEESVRETWIVAGRTIQSFARMGQGNLQEMPVKITKTIIESGPEEKKPAITPANTVNTATNRFIPTRKPDVKPSISPVASVTNKVESDVKKSPIPVQPRKPELNPINKGVGKRSVAKRTTPGSGEVIEEEVEKILAKRFNPRRKEHEYLVKWSKFAHDQNTWEPLIHLQTCQSVLEYFEVQLAKQKEQRAAAAARTLQQQQAEKAKAATAASVSMTSSSPNITSQTAVTVTKPPVAVTVTPNTPSATPIVVPLAQSSPLTNRPLRNSKVNAMDKVKQWVGSTMAAGSGSSDNEEAASKRKISDSDFDIEEEGGLKKFRTENVTVGQALVKPGVKVVPVGVKSPVKVVNGVGSSKKDDGNSAEVIVKTTKDGTASGVVKKPGFTSAKNVAGEAKVQIVNRGEVPKQGVFKVNASTPSPQSSPAPLSRTTPPLTTTTTTTRIVRKNIGGTQQLVKQVVRTTIPIQQASSPSQQQRQPLQKVVNNANPAGAPIPKVTTNVIQRSSLSPKLSPPMNKSPINRNIKPSPVSKTSTTSEQKINALRKQGLNIVKRVVSPPASLDQKADAQQGHDEDEDDELPDPFPSASPVQIPQSPPRALTLCPVTGKVLGQAEGEPTPVPSPEIEEDKSKTKKNSPHMSHEQQQHELGQEQDTQVQQILTNEDGSPIIVAGEDGTLYQVAGKNAEGQTILIAQGADGEQQCVLVAAQEGEGEAEANVLTLDAAVSEAVTHIGVHQEGQQLTEEQAAQYKMQEGVDPNQQLTIQTEDSQDGQITAEVVQADQPSPGGTRRVVLLLPDGSFMMTEVNEEQYQSLNLVN